MIFGVVAATFIVKVWTISPLGKSVNNRLSRNEFGGKYILSRAKLSNAADLGFDFVGKWDSVEGVYTMYVYEMK